MKKRATALLLILLMIVSLMPALGAGVLAAGTRFEEVTSLDADGEYILGAVKDDGSVYAIKLDGSNITSVTLTVTAASGSDAAYVETDDTGVAWKYTSSNGYCVIGENTYLYPGSSGMRTYTSGRKIVFDNDGHLSITASGNTTYYLTCSEGSFNTSTASTDAATFRLFKKAAAEPTPVDPPAGDSIDITPESSNSPTVSASIAVDETLTINVKNGSSNSTYTFTATLSNTDVAELQGSSSVSIAAGATGQFTVKGLADGTVSIVIQSNGQYSTRKGTINLTVGDGGSAPVDPPADKTVNITPDADNIPEEEVSLGIGETLAINVTNASTRSGYDFTATTSKSGVVEIKSTSVNIAASSTGTFIVTGLTDGTVDITISNNNSNSERKGIIHVTVGTGGSEEPPTPGEPKTYAPATALEDGNNYLIVNGNTGSVYVLGNEVTGTGNSAGLKGISATVDNGKITLSATDAAKAEFTAEIKTSDSGSVSAWLEQGGKYLYTASSNGLRISNEQTSSGNTGKFWHYKADDKNLLWFFKDTETSDGYTDTSNTYKYYLNCNSGTFTAANVSSTSLADTETPAIYLFVEDEGTEPATVPVTGVTLNKTTMSLTVRGTGTLTATVVPEDATNKNVTWSSSDATVATVDNGLVTAVAVGTATITVTTEDGEKTASCTVTVTAPQEIESSVIELAKLKNSSVWLIQVEEEEDKGFTYKGDAMVWSSRYEAYVIAVESATEPTLAAADFATADAAATVDYPSAANDANGSKKVDMADVQYVYNLYSGKYETLEAAGDMAKVLGADINGDGVIDSTDATPILTALRGAQA